jgi:hypothetical protein
VSTICYYQRQQTLSRRDKALPARFDLAGLLYNKVRDHYGPLLPGLQRKYHEVPPAQRKITIVRRCPCARRHRICDNVTNSLKLASPNCSSIKIPESADESFHGRITQADLHCLKTLEKMAERVMRSLALENDEHEPLGLLVQLHCCIEQAEIGLREEEILQLVYAVMVLQHFTSFNVMDLAKDERECNICMEAYLSAKDDDRREEKPCMLPCGHIFRRSCLWEHFLGKHFDLKMQICCPAYRARFGPAEYVDLIKPEEVASSWWRKYISDGNTA